MSGISPSEFNLLHLTQAIRPEIMNIVTDSDLAYKLPGDNVTLGALCRESGQVEQSYIDSFRTLKQSFAYPSVDPALDTSVASLNGWYRRLDQDLEAALLAHKDTDMQSVVVERGFPMPLGSQFHTYREALLIFYGKAACYLKALGKPLPQQMSGWIG